MSKRKTSEVKIGGESVESKANTDRTLTIEQLSEALGIGKSTLRRYQANGMPFTSGGARSKPNYYNLSEAIDYMEENGLTGERGRSILGGASDEMRAEQLRKVTAQANNYEQALKTAQMEYEKQRGELLCKEDVERGRIERIIMVKNGLLNLANTLSTQLVGLSAPSIAERIDIEVMRILEHFSKQ